MYLDWLLLLSLCWKLEAMNLDLLLLLSLAQRFVVLSGTVSISELLVSKGRKEVFFIDVCGLFGFSLVVGRVLFASSFPEEKGLPLGYCCDHLRRPPLQRWYTVRHCIRII